MRPKIRSTSHGKHRASPAATHSQAVAPKIRQFTVLCVQDDPANLMLMRRITERRAAVHLLVASNTNRGAAIARATRLGVILMDVNLPGISALDAMELLSYNAAAANIPMIAISADALDHDRACAMQAGFFRYLTKPLKISILTQALDAALTRQGEPAARRLLQVESS